jgi:hypothetical protein
MQQFTYHKFGSKWYLDFPEYLEQGGPEEDLECVGGFSELLDLVSDDDLNATLVFDNEPFTGADEAVLLESSGGTTGGYYRLHTFNGQVLDLEFWVNCLVYLQHETLPPRFYLKKG